MAQKKAWDEEYKKQRLVSLGDQPQKFLTYAFRWHKKHVKKDYPEWTVLDLGAGVGKNSNHLAKLGAKVEALEISKRALDIAKERAGKLGVDNNVNYHLKSIGEVFPFEDEKFDLIIDITSSNSLNEKEREIYLKECFRVLKPGGILFVRALCKDGDKNAKNLVKQFPGAEKDTYILPKVNITERVFTREDFVSLYSKYFNMLKLDKTLSYTPFDGQSYKRAFFFAIFEKPKND